MRALLSLPLVLLSSAAVAGSRPTNPAHPLHELHVHMTDLAGFHAKRAGRTGPDAEKWSNTLGAALRASLADGPGERTELEKLLAIHGDRPSPARDLDVQAYEREQGLQPDPMQSHADRAIVAKEGAIAAYRAAHTQGTRDILEGTEKAGALTAQGDLRTEAAVAHAMTAIALRLQEHLGVSAGAEWHGAYHSASAWARRARALDKTHIERLFEQ